MDWFLYDNGPRHERVKINLTGASSGRDYQPLKLPNQLFLTLTHIRAMLHSYRNQSIDLSCKSVDWFYLSATGRYDLTLDADMRIKEAIKLLKSKIKF